MGLGQFLRITAHNFRIFWSASFTGPSGPLLIDGPQGSGNQEEHTPVAAEAWEEISGGTRPAPDGEEQTVVGLEAEASEPLAESDDEAAADEVAKAALVQARLSISEVDDPLPADIMIESHGRRLGLTQLLESLLFVSDEPVDAVQLAKALNVSLDGIETGLQRLEKLYTVTGRGLRLQSREGRYLLVSAPEAAGAIEDFLNLDLTTKLSGPALETLAVVAYRQPVTRTQIEAVRGVDCAGVLRSMTQRGLLEEVGRLETVGRPILYGVTDLFMQHFGLTALDELPPLTAEDGDLLWAATQLAELEEEGVDRAPEPAPAAAEETEEAEEEITQ